MASAQTDVHLNRYCRYTSPLPNRSYDKDEIVFVPVEALY